MKLTIAVLLTSFIFLGCMHYPSQDYIRYESIDYSYAHGAKDKIYYRDSGRITKQTDTLFHFSLGAKKLDEYLGNRELISDSNGMYAASKDNNTPRGGQQVKIAF